MAGRNELNFLRSKAEESIRGCYATEGLSGPVSIADAIMYQAEVLRTLVEGNVPRDLSLRDYFAGLALAGELAAPHSGGDPEVGPSAKAYAEWCYEVAQALVDEKSRIESAEANPTDEGLGHLPSGLGNYRTPREQGWVLNADKDWDPDPDPDLAASWLEEHL